MEKDYAKTKLYLKRKAIIYIYLKHNYFSVVQIKQTFFCC